MLTKLKIELEKIQNQTFFASVKKLPLKEAL